MVVPLGQADSFNSSGATIIPEKETSRTRYNTRLRHGLGHNQNHQDDSQSQNVPDRRSGSGSSPTGTSALRPISSLVANARMLMPSDSLGRELDEALAGSGAVAGTSAGESKGDDGGARNQDWAYRQPYEPNTQPLFIPNSQSSSQELTFSQLLRSSPPTPPHSFAPGHIQNIPQGGLPSSSTNFSSSYNNSTQTQFSPQFNSPNMQSVQQADLTSFGADLYRPTSIHSISSHHTSDYSLSTTDIDSADGDSIMSEPGPSLPEIDMNAINLDMSSHDSNFNHQLQAISDPTAFGLQWGNFQRPSCNSNDVNRHDLSNDQSFAFQQPHAITSSHSPQFSPALNASQHQHDPVMNDTSQLPVYARPASHTDGHQTNVLWKTVSPSSVSPPNLTQMPTSSQLSSSSQNRHDPSPVGVSTGIRPSMISPASGSGSNRASREGTYSVGEGEDEKDSIAGGGEDDERRKREQRLEHRRQINRKSAQKHRRRVKEESETQAKVIAARDAKIAQLERDLAVERARVDQLQRILEQVGMKV